MDQKAYHLVAVAKFTVIPGDEIDTAVIKGNAGPSIQDGRVGVTVKISGDNPVLTVAQNTLEGAL